MINFDDESPLRMDRLQEKAGDMYDWFEVSTMGHAFVRLRDDAPPYVLDFVNRVHRELESPLPEAWIYETVRDIFYLLHDSTDWERAIKDLKCDEYNYKLLDWVKIPFAMNFLNKNLRAPSFLYIIEDAQMDVKFKIYKMAVKFLESLIDRD